MAIWLKDNRVLQIVLQDSLHQPQYVEKLEKVIRFIIKEKSLTLEDLHDIWNAQVKYMYKIDRRADLLFIMIVNNPFKKCIKYPRYFTITGGAT